MRLARGRLAVGDVFVAVQRVDAQGEVVAEALIDIGGDALLAVGAEADRDAGEIVIERGLLGDGVDGAAGGAAAGEARVRALGDFQLLDGEAFAGAHAGIAQAVDEHVAARFLAADDVAVAEGVAVFAGAQGDAGLRGEDLFQVGDAGIVDGRLGQHRDGLTAFRPAAGCGARRPRCAPCRARPLRRSGSIRRVCRSTTTSPSSFTCLPSGPMVAVWAEAASGSSSMAADTLMARVERCRAVAGVVSKLRRRRGWRTGE